MSGKIFNSAASKGVSLAMGMALVVSSTSAMAQSAPFQIAQRDVIVDTTGDSPNTYPDSGDSVPAANGNVRFACQYVNGDYTVMYYPESRPGEAYPWATPRSMGGGWSAFRRCTAIAERLETYRPNGLLEMRTDVKNGYNIVCVTTERSSDCPSQIVLTVPEGQDPITTRDRIFENLTVADSGQSTVGVNTYTGRGNSNLLNDILGKNRTTNRSRRSGIDLRAFLDPKDGGTGSSLRNGVKVKGKKANVRPATAPNSRRLNPGSFR